MRAQRLTSGAMLVCLLIATTAFAGYRGALAPLQCCTLFCKQRRTPVDPERCCDVQCVRSAAIAKSDKPVGADQPMRAVQRWHLDPDASSASVELFEARSRWMGSTWSLFAQQTALMC